MKSNINEYFLYVKNSYSRSDKTNLNENQTFSNRHIHLTEKGVLLYKCDGVYTSV